MLSPINSCAMGSLHTSEVSTHRKKVDSPASIEKDELVAYEGRPGMVQAMDGEFAQSHVDVVGASPGGGDSPEAFCFPSKNTSERSKIDSFCGAQGLLPLFGAAIALMSSRVAACRASSVFERQQHELNRLCRRSTSAFHESIQ